MSTLIARRPARSARPDPGAGPITLVSPPRQGESMPISGSLGMILVPAASGVGAVLLAVTQQDRPLVAAAGLLVLAASIAVGLAMVIGSRTGTRRRTREQRERYLDYLEQARIAARDGLDRQRRNAGLVHPSPTAAATMGLQPTRRWERRPADADFLVLRVGLGMVPLDQPVTVQVDANDPLVAYDPVCLAAAQEIAEAYVGVRDQPICLPLDGAAVCVIGTTERVRGIARALLAQLAWSHSPAEVAVLVCSADRDGAWGWLKWLPHSLSGHQRDGPLSARLITSTPAEALQLLTAEFAEGAVDPISVSRRTVLFIDQLADGPQATAELATLASAAKAFGAARIHLLRDRGAEPERVDIRLLADYLGAWGERRNDPPAGAFREPASHDAPDLVEFGTDHSSRCRLDDLDAADVLLMAKSFAPLRPGEERSRSEGFDRRQTDPLRFGDVAEIDPSACWRQRPAGDVLRVPIGTAVEGGALMLDLKESAQGGMGPHGLVIGATGSGKSELLRTLVTALTISHSPESLTLLLADFKGGATFSGLASLPHVAGMITNLQADLSLVDRFRDALGGEVQRRQEVLAAAGKLTSLEPYLELRLRRPELEPMPHLLVIVDEFSELLGARPDLADLFVTIGRIGRSMGIHLLLATQRLDTGRIRGLESHLSYRICLRTFSESESREAIGTPDAYHLPAEPGWGYLRADSPEQRLFRAVTVSRPYRPPRQDPVTVGRPILPFGAHNGIAARIAALHESHLLKALSDRSGTGFVGRTADARSPAEGGGRTVIEVAVDRLTTLAPRLPQGRQARRIWLDPLPRRMTLANLLRRNEFLGAADIPATPNDLPTLNRGSGQHLGAVTTLQPGRVAAMLGLVDIPERQRQELLQWDFTDGNGNLLVVGAGRTGKSTALRTLLVSLALQHSPAAVQVICVDFGGETLVPFSELPHVAAVATRSDPDLTARVATRIAGLLTEREAMFRRHRFESTTALRRARAAGDLDPSVAGDIVLIIDGWGGVTETDGFAEGSLDEILRRGPRVGVHTVLTVGSPSQLRARLIAGFGGRIELRLSDYFDSAIDRQLARTMPAEIPGRALVAGRHFAQLALPSLDTEIAVADSDNATDTARSVDDAHGPELHSAAQVIAAVRSQWPGQSAPRIRTLPSKISLLDLQAMAAKAVLPQGILLGLGEDDLGPARHHLSGENPHLVVYGDGRAGKTTMLRALLTQLLEQSPSCADSDVGGIIAAAEQSPVANFGVDGGEVLDGRNIAIVDYRRGLSRTATTNAAGLSVASNPAQATAICRSVAAELDRRINDPIGAEHRSGSDWPTRRSEPAAGEPAAGEPAAGEPAPCGPTAGEPAPCGPTAGEPAGREPAGRRPEIYLLVDDYDLVGTAAGNPLHSLLPYLPHARDIGFHLLLARRIGGAARAQFEAVLQVLGDLGTPVVMLSGSPAEGRLAHGLVPQLLPAGRARLAMRGTDAQLIQTAWVPTPSGE